MNISIKTLLALAVFLLPARSFTINSNMEPSLGHWKKHFRPSYLIQRQNKAICHPASKYI